HEAWFGYAELYLFLGQQDEYRRARRALLDRFGATKSQYIAEPVGRACLLLPGTEDELHRAVALIDRAVAAKGSTPEWIYRFILFARGLTEYRQGHWAAAIALMDGEMAAVLWPAPNLILAMAQHRQGQKTQARKTLALAILAYDWSAASADSRDHWIRHVLRREAEGLILPNLPAFLEGKYQPQDNDERLALLGVCQFTNRPVSLARLYTGVFAAHPLLAQDVRMGHRFNAVCAAALAGWGCTEEGAALGQEEQARWRRQAHAWMKRDLAAWASKVDSNSQADRTLARQRLTAWQTDTDLTGLRQPAALERLSAQERQEW